MSKRAGAANQECQDYYNSEIGSEIKLVSAEESKGKQSHNLSPFQTTGLEFHLLTC